MQPRFNGSLLAAFALVLAALVALAFAGSDSGSEPGVPAPEPERTVASRAAADAMPYDGRSPRLTGGGAGERVLVRLPRPALGELPDIASLDAAARKAYVASLEREAIALRSALGARGVELTDVATFERAWHGFAATVSSSDVARLGSLGVRTRPVRRFYPATSEPVVIGDARPALPAAPAAERQPIAVLAGGVSSLDPGYDAVERDRDPAPTDDPRHSGRSETSGDVLGRMVATLGEGVYPIRVAALRAAPGGVEEFGMTDELLAGIEHAVDPDGDGDTADHLPVALIGVNSPYAGFAGAPEAEAIAGAAKLGTLFVAPAGNEGPAGGPLGTLGSPGASAGLTVGALTPRGAVGRAELRVGDVAVDGAALLGGRVPVKPLTTSGPFTGVVDPAVLLKPGAPVIAGTAAIVQAGSYAVANATAAAAAGAAAIVLAEPREGHTLPSMPAGRIPVPVLGVTGAGAVSVLAAGAGKPMLAVSPRLPRIAADAGVTAPLSRFSSRGPTQRGVAKPEVALVGVWRDGDSLVAGTAVAAARAAVRAASIARSQSPSLDIEALLGRLNDVGIALPGDSGRTGTDAGAPEGTPTAPGDVPVSGVRLVRSKGRVSGVRFAVGSFERGQPGATAGSGTAVLPAERLDLRLETAAGKLVRRLTPPGGESGLLPGEFAYTLPESVLGKLAAGRYRFHVSARAPRQSRPTEAVSALFSAS